MIGYNYFSAISGELFDIYRHARRINPKELQRAKIETKTQNL